MIRLSNKAQIQKLYISKIKIIKIIIILKSLANFLWTFE